MSSQQQLIAMREAHVRVAVVCIPKLYVVFDNGLKLPIHEFFDDDHEPTDDGYEMRYYTFGDEEHGFGTGDLAAYDMISWESH